MSRFLERQGVLVRDDETAYLSMNTEGDDPMESLIGHSVTYRIAMKIIACIEDPSVIRKILDHLDRLSPITAPNSLPEPRAPPQAGLFDTP